ncbi:hypothetical protein DFH29DRAFT_877688 [Suillus ampliporus]|nr:hypothetical protein DFH29DRAFT_877688 [Suillus ampliporus]
MHAQSRVQKIPALAQASYESTKSSSDTSSSSRTISTISTSDTSTSGLCPSTIQLNVLPWVIRSANLHAQHANHHCLSPTYALSSDLAVLSDMLVSKLEKVIEGGGKGVGEVVLEVLTPQFSPWLKESKELVEAHTHAWDLPSLLIKPVQRWLKYGLLLGAVINATPEPLVVETSGSINKAFGKQREGTEELEKLREAKLKVEEVVRAVNEGRRRVEVVREVLGSGHAKDGAGAGAGSINIPKVGVVNASVSCMRSLRSPKPLASSTKSPSKQKASTYPAETDPDPGHAEAALVAALESQLKSHIIVLSHLARDALAYARILHMLFGALVKWGWAFAGVIDVNVNLELSLNNPSSNPTSTPHASTPDVTGTGQSEAFDASLALCTSVAPHKLLSALHTLRPLHLHLLHLPITRKHRPPEALLQASQSYIALRAQIALELPVYVRLLERGIDGVVLDLARGMEAFWGVVKELWGELWDALRVEGEGLGRDEDVGVSRDGMSHMDRPGSGGETQTLLPPFGALDSQASPARPRQHQHQGSYDARYARESFEGRLRRDEPKSGREKEYDARYSSGSGSYDTGLLRPSQLAKFLRPSQFQKLLRLPQLTIFFFLI